MKKVKFYFALWVAKFFSIGLKFFGRKGTNLPGKIAIKIDAEFLGKIKKPNRIIGITGTNGKTTVTNLIGDILRNNKYEYVSNDLGSNINYGVATALISNVNVFGTVEKQIAVLEIDERSCLRIFPYLIPDYLVCTNLTRDSLMRNAHTEFIFNLLNKYIPKDTTIVTSADDLICSRLKPNNEKVLYSINRIDTSSSVAKNIVRDIIACPNCFVELDYDFYHYSHIGKAKCPSCGFANEEAKYVVDKLDFKEKKIRITKCGKSEEYPLLNNNLVNAYNLVAAIATLEEFGLTKEEVKKGVDKLKIVNTRYDEAETENNSLKIITQMSKGFNPIACSSAFSYAQEEIGQKSVIVILDDCHVDIKETENITWIHEVDYEFLNHESIKQVIIAGPRRLDVYARLKIAGIPEEKIAMTKYEKDTADLVELEGIDTVLVLHDIFHMEAKNYIKEELLKKVERKQENNDN